MTKLAAFLLARISEDEAVARLVDGNGFRDPVSHAEFLDESTFSDAEVGQRWGKRQTDLHPTASWLVGVSPRRVLASCDAARRMIDLATRIPEPTSSRPDPTSRSPSPQPFDDEEQTSVLRVLALSYVDHPGFRDEWRA